jgi:ferredoxin-type protein NapH
MAAPQKTMLQKKRTLIQALCLLFLHSSWAPLLAILRWNGSELKFLCNPVLSCHSCALAWFACPVGVFAHYSAYHRFPYLAGGMVLALGFLIGRLLCGWACPFGFLQDLIYRIRSKKIELPGWTSNVKYAVLFLMVFLFPWFLGAETIFSFCRYCPASALQVTVPDLIGGGELSVFGGIKLAILAGVLALVLVAERGFCRVLCPIGALLAPLNFLSFWVVGVPKGECLECEKCNKACPTHVNPSSRIEKGINPNRALDCIVCHECQPACPQYNAERRSPRITSPPGASAPSR